MKKNDRFQGWVRKIQTTLEHLLPEYKEALKDLQTPVDRTQNRSGKTGNCTLKLVSIHVNKKNQFLKQTN